MRWNDWYAINRNAFKVYYLSSVNNFWTYQVPDRETLGCYTPQATVIQKHSSLVRGFLFLAGRECTEPTNHAMMQRNPNILKQEEKPWEKIKWTKKTRFALIFDDLWLPKFAPIKMRLASQRLVRAPIGFPDSLLAPHSPSVHGRALTALCELPNLMCSS